MPILKKLLLLTAFLSVSIINAAAQDTKTVNVLTWWGYLNDQDTSNLIKEKCGATISSDNYTSNDDMIRRFNANSNKYDLLIFSDTIYNAVKDKIILKNSKLWKKSKNYNSTIRNKYIDSRFPHNIAYFAHSLTGFIWNPSVVQLTKDDTMQSAFKKSKNNKVILLDDPVEISMLLTTAMKNNFKNTNNEISLENLKKLTQEARIYISNEINKIYNQRDFAFSYQWSGVAFSRNTDLQNYHFLINDHLSYISTDVIAQVKDNKIATCAADVLSSKSFLSKLQNKARYFSPYGNIDTIPEGEFKEAYKKFLNNLPKLHWLEPPPTVQLKKLNKEWDEVKYELTQNRE